MWTELYPRSTDELEEAMDPVVLTGLPGSARAELVREALAAKRTVELDALEAAAPGNLRQDAVRAVVDSIAGQEPRRDVH
ncbi:MAG: hypothetical protein QOE69_1328, partial [Thermoleophilaceae bacterium]|nr:hypothetical protein [Thermoleophilaceae bacterium]